MKSIYLLMLLPLYGLADPFYEQTEDEQAVEIMQNVAKSTLETLACSPNNNAKKELTDIPFDKLRLVGLMQKGEVMKALFVDEENKIYDFAKNDYLVFSGIEITEITLKSIQYIDWKNSKDCQNPLVKAVKL